MENKLKNITDKIIKNVEKLKKNILLAKTDDRGSVTARKKTRKITKKLEEQFKEYRKESILYDKERKRK